MHRDDSAQSNHMRSIVTKRDKRQVQNVVPIKTSTNADALGVECIFHNDLDEMILERQSELAQQTCRGVLRRRHSLEGCNKNDQTKTFPPRN